MPQINLKTAAGKIHQIVDQRRRRNLQSPFFFIVGAGVSHPQIPLARQIEEHCRAEAEKYGNTAPPKSGEASDSYSHWFSSAYPSAAERQQYLRDLMERKPISKANLRLAHLVLDGTVARTVFTPNFDDMLTKALELFGQRPLVCDHPLTVSRMRIDSTDTQIIHVHGSYWFYDCCNLTQDITDRSGDEPMSVMLDESLRDHSPLVVGYSGWESDILMSALKRRLQTGTLPTPLFWFCYRKETIDTLPDWLKRNSRNEERSDVYFVVPDDPAPGDAGSPSQSSSAPSSSAISKTGDSLSKAKDAGLRADSVLDALVLRFNLSVPPLTENPLAFYANQLRDRLGANDQGDAEPDTFYGFYTVISRVEKAKEAEASKAPDRLQSFRDAMSKADYRDAINIAGTIDLKSLPKDKLREIVFILWDAAVDLLDNSAEEIAGYDLVVRSADLLDATDLPVQTLAARALANKGITVSALGRDEEAIAIYDTVLSRYSSSNELALKEQVAKAMLNKSVCLSTLNRNEEALSLYGDFLRRFSGASERTIQEQVAMVLRNQGVSLGTLERGDEAIASYDELLRRFSDSTHPAIREEVAVALVNKGAQLNSLKRRDEAIACYDDLLRRFSEAQEPKIQEQVAKALRNKGVALDDLERREEAIEAYDELLRRFIDSSAPEIREQVAGTLRNKGVCFAHLNRSEDEMAVYDDLISRFADSPEPGIREQVAITFLYKAITFETLKKPEMAIPAYEEVISRFDSASEATIQEQVKKARFRLDRLQSQEVPSAPS